MHAPGRFKKAFMAQLLVSLRAAGEASKSMGLRERRDAVRLSSDVAMALASARRRAASSSSAPSCATWARALVARHAAERRNEALMRRIMGGAGYERAAAAAAGARKEDRSRRIVRRSRRLLCSCRAGRKRRSSLAASGGAMAARRMVRARLQVLRRLVPGGEELRGLSLLSETLDYVACLKTQVELMQRLCKGSRSQQE
ncbi:hypothetical protein ACP70R_003223 [Stipagrostis hirtigluma subsp. patula]